MEPRPVSFIVLASGGRLLQGSADARIERVCTDSRQVRPGDLFVALGGGRVDGHAFVEEVASKGVAAVLVQAGRGGKVPQGCAVVEVDDPRRALGRIASAYRAQLDLTVVGVAGSNGKTTTKELIASVLRARFPVVWSEASFNNDLGVPFTLLRVDASHRAAVLELGTNHPGELAPLVSMAGPRIGVLTSIGREHLEHFGDLEGVVAEEGSLAEGLPAEGVLIIPGDSDLTEAVARRARCRVVRVGVGVTNDWIAGQARVSPAGTQFEVLRGPEGFAGEYRVSLLGRHQVNNALLAAAVGHELGLTPAQVRLGLETCTSAKSRGVLTEHKGVSILDDSYNANADSMLTALRLLKDLPCAGRRIAVLGDMAELGESALASHEEVGRAAGELGVDLLIAVGTHSLVTLEAARRAGVAESSGWPSLEPAIPVLKAAVRPGDLILVKASRSAGLERVTEALRET